MAKIKWIQAVAAAALLPLAIIEPTPAGEAFVIILLADAFNVKI